MYGVHNKMIRTRVRSTHEAAVLDVGTISAWVLKEKTLLCIRTGDGSGL